MDHSLSMLLTCTSIHNSPQSIHVALFIVFYVLRVIYRMYAMCIVFLPLLLVP